MPSSSGYDPSPCPDVFRLCVRGGMVEVGQVTDRQTLTVRALQPFVPSKKLSLLHRRSMLILFAKNLVLQSERGEPATGKPVNETSVIQACSSEDKGFQR